jgi:hypothetical protein
VAGARAFGIVAAPKLAAVEAGHTAIQPDFEIAADHRADEIDLCFDRCMRVVHFSHLHAPGRFGQSVVMEAERQTFRLVAKCQAVQMQPRIAAAHVARPPELFRDARFDGRPHLVA